MIVNPILRGFNPDPCICRVGEDYYLAVSTFEWFPGVRIYHSRDLVNWRLAATPLNRSSQLDMLGDPDSGGVWAPCLSYSDGKFWLVYSDIKVLGNDSFKDGGNFLVTCDRVDGEWSEPVFLNNVGFDASLFHDDDGRKYLLNMVWDHRPRRHRFLGISLHEYSPTEQRLVGKRKMIFAGTYLRLTEGPHLYKWNGMYYLLTAEGGTRYEHAATLARSERIDGEYEVHPENPLISSWRTPLNPLQKAGHGSIVETHNGKWYLAHLTGRPVRMPWDPVVHNRGYCPLGRETALQRLEWRDGWPYVVGGNAPSLEVEDPGLPEVKWESDWPGRDDFDSPVLNPNFQTLRIPFSRRIGSLEERKGYLRLYGRESPQSTFVQAHVARRWQSLTFAAETALEFRPECFQQMAGMTCYYNTRNWVYAFVGFDENTGQRILDILQCDRGRLSSPLDGQTVAVPGQVEKIGIRVEVRGEEFQFSYSFDLSQWTALIPRFQSIKLSDDYVEGEGFFTGAFVGLSCNDMSGAGMHADFDYFSYEETAGR